MARSSGWTTPTDVVQRLRKQWDTGRWLANTVNGTPWKPVEVPLRGPRAGEVAARLGEAQSWVHAWKLVDPQLMRVERKRIGGRAIGTNEIPDRVWIDDFERLCILLEVTEQARCFADLLTATESAAPRLLPWLARHPMRALGLATEWPRLLATVLWIDTHDPGRLYLRQIDVPGVDTKFIERHRGVLGGLLDLQLDEARVDTTQSRSDFAARYGFRRKPAYIRFRLLGETPPAGLSELTVRAEEFAAPPPGIHTVFVVENEITYLAFPDVPGAMVILGGGYAVPLLGSLPWLADQRLWYWGDIDTHGFAILDRLRQRFPHTNSLLMDRQTLLAHQEHWTVEKDPALATLPALPAEEQQLYRDLLDDAYGRSVRLEQERVRFSLIRSAIQSLIG